MKPRAIAALIAAAALSAWPLVLTADSVPAVPVYIDHEGTNSLGKNLYFAVLERAESSPLIRVIRVKEQAFCYAGLQTMDPDGDDLRTIYSLFVVCGLADVYQGSNLGKCGSRVINDCASTITRSIYTHAMRSTE